MVHRIGRKIRAQIDRFSGELSTGLGKVASRLVSEMIYGLGCGGSVRLTEVARSLEEPIRLHDTHKRLSANLANPEVGRQVSERVLEMGAKRIDGDSLLIVDPSDLSKKYAKKMEYLAEVRDGSERTYGLGYWLCEVVGARVDSAEIVPLAQTLWSQEAPSFVSENEEILTVTQRVLSATGYQGTVVFDRGGDRRELYKEWAADERVDLLVRQRGDRHLLYKGSRKPTLALAEGCKTPYGTTVVKEKNGMAALVLTVSYFVAVRLGAKIKLKILARHLESAAKRIFGIPDFRYYALADGVSAILTRTGKGPCRRSNRPRPPDAQLTLWRA
jgi:hypothetical protein